MTKSGIYYILNTENGKYYIGSSNDIERRWNNHKSRLNRKIHSNAHLQRAWNKYGEDSFKFRLLETVLNKDELIDIEQHYLDTFEPEYNIAPEAGIGAGFAKETREKFSEMYSGEGNPMYGKTGKDHPRYGGTHTKEAKQRISEANSGKGNGMYGRAPWEGETRNKETKNKISATLKGKYTGLESPSAKLSGKQVKIIKHLLKGNSFNQSEIGKMFDIHQTTISKIKLGKRYSNINISSKE